MATAPQIQLRDSSESTTTLNFTTNQDSVVIRGTVALDTSAIQVSVNNGPWQSDSTMVAYSVQSITVPNLQSYPSGLPLELGPNTIRLRTIDVAGGVSPISTVSVTRVSDITTVVNQIPTGVRVRRLRGSIAILAQRPKIGTIDDIPATAGTEFLVAPSTTSFRGFNFYASSSPSGATGYFKLNDTPILSSTVFEEDVITSSSDIAIWDNTNFKKMRLRISEEDEFGKQLAVRLDKLYDTATLSDKLRLSSTFESYQLNEFVRFTHDRTTGLNADQFFSVPATDPLYYVVTGVYYDRTQNVEFETAYSQEILGAPLTIDTTIRGLPSFRASDVRLSFIKTILKVNSEIDLAPGSTTRDVTIDPFASEAERLWFLLDFVHRCQSFLTLLQIDDADGDGTSDSARVSAYKIALQAAVGYQTPEAVQALIDQQFDKLAANVGKTRRTGRPAVGQAVIYTTTRPIKDVIIPADSFVNATADALLGLPSMRFRIGGSYVIPVSDIDAYYNFDKKRWQIVVDIVAETIGEAGNRAPDSIKSITGVSGVLVTNDERTVFGLGRESNADLANRCMLGYAAVDTGTEGGYALAAAEQTGIIRAKIVKSGDPLMMRDYDPVRNKHIGGKTDIWVQGSRERQITETFAFTFEIARDIQVRIVDLSTLTFRVEDSRVTPSTPLIEILDTPTEGLGVRNTSSGQSYSLTGVSIIDYQTFRLNTSVTQPVTHIDDLITADYRFRVANKFFFSYQPVRRIISVVGEVSGALSGSTNYSLYKTDDPLLDGESTVAKDYLALIQFDGKPSGTSIVATDEEHTLVGLFPEPLKSIGINTKTLHVYSEDRSVEYAGPGTADPDYDILLGTATTPVQIVRTAASTIPNGGNVIVDYVHDENFKVTYVINDLLQQFQQVLERRRHVAGDVLAKQAVENAVNIETTIQLKKGVTRDKVDPLVRSNVSLDLNRKVIGQGSGQSDIIKAIDSTEGVNYQIVPFNKMAYADGARKLREPILSSAVRVPSLDRGGNLAYVLANPLRNPTTDGGGLSTEHKGVFQDDIQMTMSDVVQNVCLLPNQAFIIGAKGASITGYSDDATLLAAGYPDVALERLRRTANHVVLSLPLAKDPDNVPEMHRYTVSYVIRGDAGSHDIESSAVEYIGLGSLTATYREGA